MATANGNDAVFKPDSLRKMVYPRVFSSPVIHNKNIYVIGGCDQMGQPVDSFEMYDTTKKKWFTLQSMPTKRAAPAVGVVGDKIIAIGGVGNEQKPISAVEVYDIKEKKWTELDALPTGLLGISSVVRDEKVLTVGGMSTDTNPQDFFRSIVIDENKWKGLPPLPTPRYATFSFLINDKLYVIGGRQGKEPCLAFEVYDFVEEKWRKLPNVPSKRVFAMYTCTDKYIFSLGGLIQPGNKGFSDANEIFDLETGVVIGVGVGAPNFYLGSISVDIEDILIEPGMYVHHHKSFPEEWKTGKKLPTRRGDFAVGVIQGKVICAGGLGNQGKPLDVIEIYDPDTDTWTNAKEMPLAHCSCAYTMFEDKLFVMGGLSGQGPTNCVESISLVTEEDEQAQRKSQPQKGGKKKQS